jgi:hypothetical protein
MNSLDQSWNRLTAAARGAVAGGAVPAPSPAWITRVGALGFEELRRSRNGIAWLAWAMPGFGVALLVAIIAVAAWGSPIAQPEGAVELVALADPLEGNSLLP